MVEEGYEYHKIFGKSNLDLKIDCKMHQKAVY